MKPTHSIYLKERVHLPVPVSLDLIKEIPVAVKSRFIRPFLTANPEMVKLFFKRYRYNPSAVGLTDLGTGHFLHVLENYLKGHTTTYDMCIDLGCGNGSLKNYPLHLWKNYIGIDLYNGDKQSAGPFQFIEHDLNLGLPNLVPAESTLFIAINSLCYLHNISTLMGDLFKRPGRNTIIILEPAPGILWESAFHGIPIYYRTPKQILSHIKPGRPVTITPLALGLPLTKRWIASNLIEIAL